MAEKAGSGSWIARGVHRHAWTGVTNGDHGFALSAPHLPDKTIYVGGTVGTGGGVGIYGSNATGPTNGPFEILHDPQGNNLTFTVSGVVEQLLENPRFIRPFVTSGDASTSFNIIIVSRGDR